MGKRVFSEVFKRKILERFVFLDVLSVRLSKTIALKLLKFPFKHSCKRKFKKQANTSDIFSQKDREKL
jgi:hypothetical protein